MIALACAHPAKFPDAVEAATGVRPALPPHLADLLSRRERLTVLPNEIAAIQRYIGDHARPVAAPARRAGGAA
jgi:threonine synthase